MKEFMQILLLIIPALLMSCSSTKQNSSTGRYAVADSNLYAWVNLMPGSRPRFHITGDVEIHGEEEVQLDSIIFKEVKVSQNNDNFYSFRPTIDLKTAETKNKNSKIRSIHFSDGRGYEIGSMFNFGKPVKLQFVFSYKTELFIYNTREVKVEKVY